MIKSLVLLAALSASAYDGGLLKTSPKGLSGSDWSGIRAEYQRHRQAAFPVDGGHRARNYGQRWVTRFDGRGFDVTPNAEGWRWGLELQSYGFPGQEHGVKHARATADVEKLSYQWDSVMTEWFVNGNAGLEHGFTLASRPGNSESALALHLAVRGTLTPRVSPDGRRVSFLDDRGTPAINYAGLKVTDAGGRELAARFTREPQGLRLEVEERGARYPITIDPLAQQAYLKPAAVGTTQAGDLFGYSVGVSGDTVVVGARDEDSSSLGVNSTPNELAAGSSGAAYVFVRSAGVWSQQAYLKPAAVGPGGQAGDHMGWSVAISGDTVVVGAPDEDSATTGVNSTPAEGATNSGAAYVFTRNAGVWSQQAYLKPSVVGTTQSGSGDEFGYSVAVSGDTLVVGAYDEPSSTTGINSTRNELAPGAGAAYVFARSGVTWSQQAYLKPAAVGTTQANDHFGNSVAVSGDTVVVGAFQEDSSSTGINSTPNELSGGAAGAAYVFARSGIVWVQQAYLKPAAVGTSQAGDQFGISVTVSGDTVVVGAFHESSSTLGVNSTPNEGAGSSGAAYVFTRSSGVWSQQAYLKPAAVGTTQGGDNFGYSVALSGDALAVGAPGEGSSTTGIDSTPNELASASGAVYVFTRSAGVWSQQTYLKPAAVGTTQLGDQFGWSVAMSGDTVVAGAINEDSSTLGVNTTPNEAAVQSGAAYVFTVPLPVTITVNTSPFGLLFSSSGAGCNPGSGYSAPQVLAWTSGSSCTLSVSTPQAGYSFIQWEDGSTNPVRAITAPSVNSSYTAIFTAAAATYAVSGQVVRGGAALSGVTVTLAGGPGGIRTTDSSGNYSFLGLPSGGNYTVTPSLAANTFAPSNTAFSNLQSNGTANFLAHAIAAFKVGAFGSGYWVQDLNGNFAWDGLSVDRRAYFSAGQAGEVPVSGDWNGDGKDKLGTYINGTWILDYNGNGQWDGSGVDKLVFFGGPGWTPVVGDWNGDGKAKIGVYRDGTWMLDYDGNYAWNPPTDKLLFWGGVGYSPVLGDWNNSGWTKVGVHKDGLWLLDYDGDFAWNAAIDKTVFFGGSGYTPVVGDWNGSGNTKIGATLDGLWVIDYNGNFLWDGLVTDKLVFFGGAGWIPMVGDWDGNGKVKVGAYKDGTWVLDVNGNFTWDPPPDQLIFFGGPGQTPVAGKW